MTKEITDDNMQVDFCRSMILIDWKHIYVFNIEGQRNSETYKRCWIYMLEMTQEMIKDEMQAEFFGSMSLTD